MRASATRRDPDRRIFVLNWAYDAGYHHGLTGIGPLGEATGACREQYYLGVRHGREWRERVALRRHNR